MMYTLETCIKEETKDFHNIAIKNNRLRDDRKKKKTYCSILCNPILVTTYQFKSYAEALTTILWGVVL